MSSPSFLEYVIVIAISILLVVAGLFLLSNFNRLLNGIKNELLRKNLLVWLIMFCFILALSPLNGDFIMGAKKMGWGLAIMGEMILVTLNSLFVFNATYFVASNKKLRRLSFVQHKLLVVLTLVIMGTLVNLAFRMLLMDTRPENIKYSIIVTIYFGSATGLIYVFMAWQELERKQKNDAKELELSQLRELKAKAELDALHSKVNPHFLYNALNSIADLSVTDGKKARKMTIALADLFRYSINYGQGNFSTIVDEIAMSEVYLQIEKIRFEDRLQYSVSVEKEAGHYLIPRFLLQPLVENAVKHGLKVTGQLTEISVAVKIEEGCITLKVSDNGPFFPALPEPGYGLKSVFDKLDLLFPGEYSIHFYNEPVKEVVIHITKLIKHEPAL